MATVAGLFYLERLSNQKAGVNHHLRFRKTFINRNYLTDTNVTIIVIMAVAILLLILFLYFKPYRRYKRLDTLIILAPAFWSIILITALVTDFINGLNAYPYFIMGLGLNLLLSLIVFGVMLLSMRKAQPVEMIN